MVCIICFDFFALIRFLKHGRYSSEVINKLVNNPDVTYLWVVKMYGNNDMFKNIETVVIKHFHD